MLEVHVHAVTKQLLLPLQYAQNTSILAVLNVDSTQKADMRKDEKVTFGMYIDLLSGVNKS